MSDMQKFTRIILISLALYMLIRFGAQLAVLLPHISLSGAREIEFSIYEIAFGISMLLYTAIVVYLLIFKADKWAVKIAANQQDEQPPAKTPCLPAAFRIIAVFSGILYMYWLIPTIISTIQSHILIKDTGPALVHRPPLDGSKVATWIVLLVLGVYLLCGAPHFVRWHVRKTLELCGESADNDDSAGEELA